MPEKPTIEIPRIEGESAKAYQARVDYVIMGAGRSLDKLRQNYGKTTAYTRQLETWSSLFGWTESARLYDAQLAELATEQHQSKYLVDLEAHRQRSTEAAKGLYTVAGKLLQRMNAQVNTLEITPATLGVLLKAFQTSLDLEAHALGLLDRLGDDDT